MRLVGVGVSSVGGAVGWCWSLVVSLAKVVVVGGGAVVPGDDVGGCLCHKGDVGVVGDEWAVLFVVCDVRQKGR